MEMIADFLVNEIFVESLWMIRIVSPSQEAVKVFLGLNNINYRPSMPLPDTGCISTASIAIL